MGGTRIRSDAQIDEMAKLRERGWGLSRDDRADASAIAASFGGGGHRNAAGFGVPL